MRCHVLGFTGGSGATLAQDVEDQEAKNAKTLHPS